MPMTLMKITFDNDLIIKFLKFAGVGASGVLVNFGITYLFKEILKWNKYLSSAIGFVFAATSNYILNRIWTFQSLNPEIGTEYAKFFLISLVGMGIDTLTLYILTDKLKWNFYLSKVFAIGVATLWNFFGNFLFTFAQ
jgi:Predicted membrane protein